MTTLLRAVNSTYTWDFIRTLVGGLSETIRVERLELGRLSALACDCHRVWHVGVCSDETSEVLLLQASVNNSAGHDHKRGTRLTSIGFSVRHSQNPHSSSGRRLSRMWFSLHAATLTKKPATASRMY
jgi:hypothetical protein